MENTEWSKTIMTVYKYLKRMTLAFDRLIDSKATNSFYTSTSNYAFNNVFDITNSMLELIDRKVTLINLKVLADKVLKSMKPEYAKILILKYIENQKGEQIAKTINCTLRTYFRKSGLALENFYKTLCVLGYDSDKLTKMLKGEKWIMSVYYDFCQQQGGEESKTTTFFIDKIKNNIFLEIKKVSFCAS